MVATTWGPLAGPIASGYVSVVSWRWSYWILLIIAGATWPFLILMPETYGPVILKRKAKALRKKTGDENILAPTELLTIELRELIVVVLTRPVRMFFTEAIVTTSCLYLSVVYGIFYSKQLGCVKPYQLRTDPENSVLPGIPNCLWRRLQLQSWRARSGFPSHWRRRGYCRRHIHVLGPLL
jgi:MFS family permease